MHNNTNLKDTGPRSAVGNMYDCRYVSDSRSRGRMFNPRPFPYFRGDHEIITTVILLPTTGSRRVVASYKQKNVHEVLNSLVKLAQEVNWLSWHDHSCWLGCWLFLLIYVPIYILNGHILSMHVPVEINKLLNERVCFHVMKTTSLKATIKIYTLLEYAPSTYSFLEE